jgi:hypothetical protein
VTVDVSPAKIDAAAEDFRIANGVAAQFCNGLSDALAGYGSMAGDDKTSEDFVAEYDGAAREAVGGIGDLVGALGGLARLLALTAANHRHANASSVYSANPPSYDGDQTDTLPDSTVSVTPPSPPSALGGDDPDTPQLWDMITDYLEGYAWPGADTGRLREAAGTWRSMGSILTNQITPYLDSAKSHLADQVSPEIPDALVVIADLRLQVEQLGFHCTALGDACEGYASQVEQVKETVRGIIEDLLWEIGITAVAAGVVSLFTAGIGAGGGAAIAATRLASAGRKIVLAFSAMKAATKAKAVAKLISVVQKVPLLRRRFTRVRDAANAAQYARYQQALRALMGKPHTRDPDLTRLMDNLYRPNAKIGSGSTAAAVRHELATGQLVGGVNHSQKARDMIVALERWLKNHPTATPGDRAAAENVIKDLRDALAGN